MRLPPLAAAAAAILIASSANAQDGMPPVASHQPLPGLLVPERRLDDSKDARRAAADGLELGLLTGVVVGTVTGGVYGAGFARECGEESDCTLSREYKTMILAIVGGALGGLIGAGTSYLLGTRNPLGETDAPLAVSSAAGGVSIGVTLRH
jgi:hypothetical protein